MTTHESDNSGGGGGGSVCSGLLGTSARSTTVAETTTLTTDTVDNLLGSIISHQNNNNNLHHHSHMTIMSSEHHQHHSDLQSLIASGQAIQVVTVQQTDGTNIISNFHELVSDTTTCGLTMTTTPTIISVSADCSTAVVGHHHKHDRSDNKSTLEARVVTTTLDEPVATTVTMLPSESGEVQNLFLITSNVKNGNYYF